MSFFFLLLSLSFLFFLFSIFKSIILTTKKENLIKILFFQLPVKGSNVDIGSLCFLSFLPMAHSFEQCVQTTLLMKGAQIGYFGGQLKSLQSDMQTLRPSAIILVPRLLNRVYNSVLAQVRASQTKSLLLRTALSIKQKQISK